MLTREIFGNISATGKGIFYLLGAIALILFALGILRRVRLWRVGTPRSGPFDYRIILSRLWIEVITQRRIGGRGIASLAHRLLFSGFFVLFIGTVLIAIEHAMADLLGRGPRQPVFHYGVYFAVYEFVLDAFGLAFLAGCFLFVWRRWQVPSSSDTFAADGWILAAFIFLGGSGYLIEGARIVREQTPLPGFSFVGWCVAQVLERTAWTPASVAPLHAVLWWLHAVVALAIVAAFPYTRLWHSLAGAATITLGANQPMGVLRPVTVEEFEQSGRIGVETLRDFSRAQLMSLDACVACGRCQDACPAHAAGKPLSPKRIVQDLRRHLDEMAPSLFQETGTDSACPLPTLSGSGNFVIDPEAVWSCTTCNACVSVCPLRVDPLELIVDLRRHLVAQGELHGPPATALAKTQRSGNPWGLPIQDRLAWAEGLGVRTFDEAPDAELLYWVGCAASYDRRARRVARSVVRLLQHAQVHFAVLGNKERCTGESARRMGDEFVFQELASGNIELLQSRKIRTILTHCPHCLNSFRQDYPQFGGRWRVVHHTEFLAELVQQGKLQPQYGVSTERITLHDPCYLARVSGIVDPPRQLIQISTGAQTPPRLREPQRAGATTACCGAGGGRMWFDDGPQTRIGRDRVAELAQTGAETVAVACPFCLIMLKDGFAAQAPDVQVLDVAELLAQAVFGDVEPA